MVCLLIFKKFFIIIIVLVSIVLIGCEIIMLGSFVCVDLGDLND